MYEEKKYEIVTETKKRVINLVFNNICKVQQKYLFSHQSLIMKKSVTTIFSGSVQQTSLYKTS